MTRIHHPCGSVWRKPPFSRYKQLWSQLCLHNEIVCRRYTQTSPIVVPIIPESYRPTLLYQKFKTMTHPQQATLDLKRPLLECVKLVIGLECFQTLTNTVRNVLFVKALVDNGHFMHAYTHCNQHTCAR